MATYWVAACVAVNNFSLACEDDEQADDEDEAARDCDPFIIDGLSSSLDSDLNANLLPDSRRLRGS
jgi:hypothetical protein